jgi:hypothetical protein
VTVSVTHVDYTATPIFRSVSPAAIRASVTPTATRAPKNVSYFVDNLWEWSRPECCPSRRSVAFGSPRPELALSFGPADGVVCGVLLARPFKIVQLRQCADARSHGDVDRLTSIVARLPPAVHRALDRPVATREQVEQVLASLESDCRRRLRRAVRLWESVECSADRVPRELDPVGELWFEAPSGYLLRPV